MDYLNVGILVAVGMALGASFTLFIIPILKKTGTGQNIREEGPSSHQSKAGTPTMGGIAIIGAVLITCLVTCFVTSSISEELVVILITFVLFGALGFLDDYLKVVKKQNLGLRAWQKLGLQIIVSLLPAVYQMSYSTSTRMPVAGDYIDLGLWYTPFVAFVIVATVNSVNLTDGLDGLAAGTTSIVALFFACVGLLFDFSAGTAFYGALTGACLGFLVFNKNPAKVFMGDTGSLALGGGLAAAAVSMRMELLLPVAGFVYVAEAGSVIIQVLSFKTTGKRVFKMSPIHHHFELSGMPEKWVVVLFWALTGLFCVIGFKLL
jgi:phospho-N-acetylmuramoyl-pentapeptide-transferase